MKSLFGLLLLAILAIGAYYLVDIEITKEARLPDIDVQVSGGQLPEAVVRTGSINLTKEKVEVTVPDVDVKMVEKEVSVPGIEVDKPAESTAN